MRNALIQKLGYGADLTEDDVRVLEAVTSGPRAVARRTDLICEGDRPEDVHVILEGLACRYKMLPDGRRQIVAFLVAGDICDVHAAVLGEMDHSIGTLSECRVVDIPRRTIIELTDNHPRITRALWWSTLVDEAVLREWIVGSGRGADKQLAHLLCELHVRLQLVGAAGAAVLDLPITQTDLADTLGLSVVHVNRVLGQLRSDGLIEVGRGKLGVPDVGELMRFADFTSAYLHLIKRRWSKAALTPWGEAGLQPSRPADA